MVNPYAYDVFISFRGEDCRHRFLSHLHNALARVGIKTFKDDESLERGKSISPEIKNSIHKSRISIVIFSKNYASSSWCLEELVEIMRCRDEKEQIVLPIFLDVDPSNVTQQTGSFGEAFAEHEKSLNLRYSSGDTYIEHEDHIQSWRSCLTKAGEIAGWESTENEDEAKFIDEIAMEVMRKLTCTSPKQPSELVGMDSRVKKIYEHLALDEKDVRAVGICGIGGIGKTTIARFIYIQISGKFDAICFHENVRENVQRHGLKASRKELLSKITAGRRKSRYVPSNLQLSLEKVLIVLDDVDDIQQLKELDGRSDRYGPGSRIIITTRGKNLLMAHGVSEIYEVPGLNDYESLQLFHQHAFRDRQAKDEFMKLTPQFVNRAGGLPLVIKLLGSSLSDMSLSDWKNELKNLDKTNWEVPNLLRMCFDRLNAAQKKIFHDIACFFKGDDEDYVTNFHEVFGASEELKNLRDKCFISVTDKRIWIHDLLQETVHNISNEAATCGRYWKSEDIQHLLSRKKSAEKVEIMTIDASCIDDVLKLSSKVSGMSNLRLLKIYNSTNGDSTNIPLHKICSFVVRRNLHFPSELIYFRWEGYRIERLPGDFNAKNLFELSMPRSYLKKFPKKMKCFEKLKFIDLSYSMNLIETPDFSKTPNLENLILNGCTNLEKVHDSIASHRTLQLLNMKDCTSLRKFPSPLKMKALKMFNLSGCSKLQNFPEIRGNMECLLQLYVDGTATKQFHPSIKNLTGLEVLFVEDSTDLNNILESIGSSGKLLITKVTTGGGKIKPYWSKWGLSKYAIAAINTAKSCWKIMDPRRIKRNDRSRLLKGRFRFLAIRLYIYFTKHMHRANRTIAPLVIDRSNTI